MNFYFIVGPQAVGKMTVGQEIARLTGAKLFYNHMTIDLVSQFFDYGTKEGRQLVKEFRSLLFNQVVKTPNYPGFIFTYVCDFNSTDGPEFIYTTCENFNRNGHTSYIIELNASYSIRKARNVTANRMHYKLLKRNKEQSEKVFDDLEKNMRTTSYKDEITWDKYLRIDNEELSPIDVAKYVIDYFKI